MLCCPRRGQHSILGFGFNCAEMSSISGKALPKTAQKAIECDRYADTLTNVCLWVVAEMQVGQKVRLQRLRDRASQEIINHLGQTGTIQGFKMTDGSGVGVVVKFEDNFSTWFFEDELEPVG